MRMLEVLVVGGGVMGAATALALARRGRRVLLLEQFAVGHARGSSHGSARLLSYTYPTPGYAQLVTAARAAWQRLEADSGQRLLIKTAALDLGLPDQPWLRCCAESMTQAGASFELLDTTTIRARFPQLAIVDDAIGLYQPEVAIMPASRCVATLIEQARRYGAAIAVGARVDRIVPDRAGARVDASGATYWAQRVVITAGSYTASLLADLGLLLPLPVTREQKVFFQPRDRVQYALGFLPVVHDRSWQPDQPPLVCFPDLGEGVLAFCHGAGPVIDDPYLPPPLPDPAASDVVAQRLARLAPLAVGRVIRAETCRFTNTGDGDFIIDHHPAYQQVIIAVPCAGHGFKFAPLIGEILADLAIQGGTAYDIAPFRLARLLAPHPTQASRPVTPEPCAS